MKTVLGSETSFQMLFFYCTLNFLILCAYFNQYFNLIKYLFNLIKCIMLTILTQCLEDYHFSDLLSEENESLSWTFNVSPIHIHYMGYLIYFLSHWIKEKTFPNFLKIVKPNMSKIYTAKRSCVYSPKLPPPFFIRDVKHICFERFLTFLLFVLLSFHICA